MSTSTSRGQEDQELLNKLSEIVNTSIQSIKDDLKEELSSCRKRQISEEVDEKIKKRIKEAEVPKFKRKLNKNQYEYNLKVKQVLTDVDNLLDENNVEKAKEKVKEGKVVKIAEDICRLNGAELMRLAERLEELKMASRLSFVLDAAIIDAKTGE